MKSQISCPDCDSPILLEESNGTVIGIPPDLQKLPRSLTNTSPVSFRMLFGILGAIVAVAVLWNVMDFKNPASQSAVKGTVPAKTFEDFPDDPSPEIPDQQPANTTHKDLTIQDRLQKIHELTQGYLQQNGVYPNGKQLEADEQPAQVSWIAELMLNNFDDGAALAKQRPWNDPANESFVRRRLSLFQNPEISKAIGNDRYPATHFAGVTGVGDDAAQLPAHHPRAGIFSPYRVTRLPDIIDGTANTMMIVGVQSQLGSWARPGTATLRSLTAEPYVNGPDGLGTGQNESMFVLMADGSVKTVTNKTSPIIVRRMATIADGLSLDPQTPGDPLTMTGPKPAIENRVDDPPIEPMLTPEPPPFDITSQLDQTLRSYELSKPTALRTLLIEYQELAGVPVDVSRIDDATLSKEIAIDEKNVTLRELLEKLTSAAGVEFKLESFSIIIHDPTSNDDSR